MTKIASSPPVPKVSLPLRRRLREIRNLHTGPILFREACGGVARVDLAPRWLMPPVVVVTSAQGVHDVLTAPTTRVDTETFIAGQLRHSAGDFLFNLPPDRWLPRRTALQPLFTKHHVERFAGHMTVQADSIATTWGETVVDLNNEMRRLTLTVLGRSILGVDLASRTDRIRVALAYTTKWVTDRSLRPVRAPMWLPTPARHRMRVSRAVLDGVAAEAIRACRSDAHHDAPLVRLLLATVDPASGRLLTDAMVRAELIQFLLAGHDSTATTLTYALWQLGRNPEMQARVLSEVAVLGPGAMTVADTARLPYTVQVLHEALRLCPPCAAIGRRAITDLVVDGFRVDAGTFFLIGFYALHRDPELWVDPERFDPDRFAPDRPKPARWQYLPFGGGRRSCLGDHFAMLEATLGLASIIRVMEVTSIDDDFPLAVPFTMTAGGPILARVRTRM